MIASTSRAGVKRRQPAVRWPRVASGVQGTTLHPSPHVPCERDMPSRLFNVSFMFKFIQCHAFTSRLQPNRQREDSSASASVTAVARRDVRCGAFVATVPVAYGTGMASEHPNRTEVYRYFTITQSCQRLRNQNQCLHGTNPCHASEQVKFCMLVTGARCIVLRPPLVA